MSAALSIGAALARVKVVDPACGSGAYLLGMMQELVELMTALYSAQLSRQSQDLYNLKLRIIEQNLYGADIDQFAVNIAMLRLWLSLSIEYDGPAPQPLPNLDFKIVCGDSLLGPDPNPENYIRWGEEAGFNERSVTRTQTPWWKPPLQAQKGAKLLWGRTHADSHRIFLNPELLISVRFFRLHPKENSLTEPLWALKRATKASTSST